jgi:hypothetical protein
MSSNLAEAVNSEQARRDQQSSAWRINKLTERQSFVEAKARRSQLLIDAFETAGLLAIAGVEPDVRLIKDSGRFIAGFKKRKPIVEETLGWSLERCETFPLGPAVWPLDFGPRSRWREGFVLAKSGAILEIEYLSDKEFSRDPLRISYSRHTDIPTDVRVVRQSRVEAMRDYDDWAIEEAKKHGLEDLLPGLNWHEARELEAYDNDVTTRLGRILVANKVTVPGNK